jgi:hypothetical protein
MTQPNEREDGQWLDALAGRPDQAADPQLNRQAAAVRRALGAQARDLDATVPPADPALLEQTMFRLRREGLLRKPAPWKSPRWLAVAASAVLGIGIALQMTRIEDETVRSGGPATVQIVSSPEARLEELLAGLSDARAEPRVDRLDGGRIRVTLKATPEALDYLSTQRIEPMVSEGVAVIELRPLTAEQ